VAESNLEIVRSIVDAANRGALDEVGAFYDPDIVLRNQDDTIDAHTCEGREQVLSLLRDWYEAFEVGIAAEIDEQFEQDDRVLVCLRIHARGRSSGIEVEGRRWWAYWFHAGSVARIEIYIDRDEAITAAGMSPN
jgi:ketosteroid isomerase-like protein